MSDLKAIEKVKIEKLFNMESGYVLDFTNRTFQEFIIDVSDIDIYKDEDEGCNISKANRLRCFWKEQPNYIVGNLLKALLEYYRIHNIEADQLEQNLWQECLKIAERLTKNIPIQNLKTLTIDNAYIQEHIKKCDKKIIEEDFSGAITNARSLVETILLHIESGLFMEDEKFTGDMAKLYKKISKKLNLSSNEKTNNAFKKIMSGLCSIISGLAELGNDLGDRHGKRIKQYNTEKHHAVFIVNTAKTFTEFIFSSYEKQNKESFRNRCSSA